jgi:hypothetical protein
MSGGSYLFPAKSLTLRAVPWINLQKLKKEEGREHGRKKARRGWF